ncbi:MAG: acetyl-CoA carboxylase biotin carboxyl carrier protein subunit, partial [Treponema sp.]|nr:acetyl-CoA carboxylase biotin carboxyl carrier protein subunit [Treponema sp.]
AAQVPAAVPPPIPAAAAGVPSGGSLVVPAPVAGSVIRHSVTEGTAVNAGDTILIMESMKMELEIKSTAGGKVRFLVPAGTPVAAQQPIAEIG